MAEIVYTRLGKEIITDTQTGATLLKGAFVSLPWVPALVAVYWQVHAGETFRQSLALADEVGNILDETPAMKPLLDTRRAGMGPGIFYVLFPGPDATTSLSIETVSAWTASHSMPWISNTAGVKLRLLTTLATCSNQAISCRQHESRHLNQE